jgi:hypothetical protein
VVSAVKQALRSEGSRVHLGGSGRTECEMIRKVGESQSLPRFLSWYSEPASHVH